MTMAKWTDLLTLQLTVRFDSSVATPEEVCDALNTLLCNATGTPGVLEEVGNPSVGDFEILIGPDA
jgi:hypothetical protein